jgi:uncharacterized protein (DUF3084 family)
MNTSGKTATIFLVLIVVVLGSVSSISLFLLNKEKETVKDLEARYAQLQSVETQLQAQVKEAEKQIYILQENNKEADERINNLMDDLELEEGLREEVKAENQKLKEALEAEARTKAELRQKLTQELEALEKRTKDDVTRLQSLETTLDNLQKEKENLRQQLAALEKYKAEQEARKQTQAPAASAVPVDPAAAQAEAQVVQEQAQAKAGDQVDLEKIVVTPDQPAKGRVLSVDADTEFLIFDLGAEHGIKQGDVLGVYRGDQYLGDIRVSRAQADMSAADFIPPFSSRKVRKNDTVIVKP